MKFLLGLSFGGAITLASFQALYNVPFENEPNQSASKQVQSLIKPASKLTYGDKVIITDGFYAGFIGCAENMSYGDESKHLFSVWGSHETHLNSLPFIGTTWLMPEQYERYNDKKCVKSESK